MKRIRLTQGKWALVDDKDFDWLSEKKWYALQSAPGRFYAASDWPMVNGVRDDHTALMHRLILGVERKQEVDHINMDRLDNRRANLRVATSSQNKVNASKRKGVYTSRFRGVHLKRDDRCVLRKPWTAQVAVNGRRIFIGNFATEEEAARARDVVARKYFGEFARTNFR